MPRKILLTYAGSILLAKLRQHTLHVECENKLILLSKNLYPIVQS